MKTMFGRRLLLGAMTAIAMTFALPFTAFAAHNDKGDPVAFVVDVSNEILDAIRKDPALKAGNTARVHELVDQMIMPVVDFRMMTRMTVGPQWRSATAAQRDALQKGFSELLIRVYSGALSNVKEQRAEARPMRYKQDATDLVVRTQLKGATQQPINLDYRVYRNKEGRWKIVDVNVEGIWMVENYRSQFASTLSQDGIDGLIKLLNEQSAPVAKRNQKTQ